MWIVTKSVNDYNQYGDYFVMAYHSKPSVGELVTALGCTKEYANYLLKTGGGRIGIEDEWFYLTEIKPGQLYEEK